MHMPDTLTYGGSGNGLLHLTQLIISAHPEILHFLNYECLAQNF